MGCFEGKVGVEVLNDVVMERTDLKRSSDWVAGSEAEPCAKKHAVKAPNDAECNPQTESPLKEALPSVELEKNCHASEGLKPCAENDTECNMQTENPLKEALPSVELEKSCHALEKLEPCGENDTECNMQTESPLKEALPSVELEKNCHALEELEPCVESDKQVVEKGVELGHSSENSTEDIVSGTDSKFSPKQPENEAPADSVQLSNPLQAKDDGGNLSVTAEKSTKEVLDDNELENRMKEVSNEDIFSEVSDPKLSPGNTTSSHCAGATLSKEPGSCNIPGGCAEVSSLYSGNSSSESESLSEQEHIANEASRDVSTSCVVLEIPKHVSTTGIRKITFRFSKPKEYCENVSSVLSAQPVYGEYSDDAYRIEAWNASVADHGRLFHERRVPPSSYSLKQLTQKVNPDIYPANVKKLLATGILEGARVKYISVNRETELSGIIWSDGYLCSCSLCNFSRVLSAYEFELHAGVKTRHPNNHIYLENGKPVYSIVQELKTAPLSMIDDVIHQIAGSSINMEKFQIWKANLQKRDSGDHGDLSSSGQTPGFYYPDISYPSPMRKDIRMPPSYCSVNSQLYQDNVQLTGEQRKRVVKRPGWLSSNSDPDFEMEKVCEGGNGSGTKKRDNDLHRQLFLPNGLPDGTDLAYYSKGKKILGGFKQDNGILCSCCHTVISPSQFESHAGWAVKRQPYRNIYTSTGLTLHDIALMLANGRNIASSNSDDMCAACGDGGDLLLCRGCPRAFHTACLGSHCGPSSDWLCPYCVDKSIPVRRGPGRPPLRQTRAVKAPLFVGGGCVVCRAPDFSVAKFDDRTVLLCDQCEKEYHVGCLRESGLCDLKELPRDKWFCCNDCHMIHTELQKFALGGAQVAPPEVYAAISKKHIEKGLMDVPASDFKWRILSGKSRYSEHLPLLSRASAIFRECFDPIVAKSGRDLIPIMVYGRNISGQEFGGMYCVVLIVKSVVVSAGLLRIFGREVAELPLVATCRDSQGKGYFLALFSCIERLLASMNVKNLVLPAAEEAESIWTKRLGFRRMSNARESRYNKEIQFTVFKGTTMLEKEVQSEDITDI